MVEERPPRVAFSGPSRLEKLQEEVRALETSGILWLGSDDEELLDSIAGLEGQLERLKVLRAQNEEEGLTDAEWEEFQELATNETEMERELDHHRDDRRQRVAAEAKLKEYEAARIEENPHLSDPLSHESLGLNDPDEEEPEDGEEGSEEA